ncbi:hypothetical protein M9H77_23106 [Catharanthus roseus]|uniref:Uncharacterized protein n=1 Tax=Catharanthus roseus TaxID=4058 RepID=A0ACC0AV33_CATRO|nr:hypothetical protein M9H77_23106 [Catharanthus roseus]
MEKDNVKPFFFTYKILLDIKGQLASSDIIRIEKIVETSYLLQKMPSLSLMLKRDKATEYNRVRPIMSSYLAIMEQYAKRGDIHNTEKLFHCMRQVGYVGHIKPFQSLIRSYSNAKTLVYGILERMKADNLFPNKATAA